MIKRRIICLIFATALLISAAGCEKKEPDEIPPPDSHFLVTRPLNRVMYVRDPFIYAHKEFGVYYMYGTTKNPSSKDGSGFVAYKSKDLENWSGPFSAFNGDVLPEKNVDFWAPEVHKVGDYYYLFGTFGPEGKHRRTQILRSKSLEKEFDVWGDATPKGVGALDATFYEEDGKYYSIYCEEWISRLDREGLMVMAELNSDLTDIKQSTVRTMFKAGDSPLQVESGGKITDGCFMFRNRYGELFMLWSTFSNKSGMNKYIQTYAMSDNGKITGNWIHSNTPLYADDGGHGMFFKDFDGNLKYVLHTPNSPPEHIEIHDIDDSERGVLKLK